MSDVVHVCRIVATGTLSAWQAATNQGGDTDGLNATTNLYEVSEPAPRTNVTHKLGSGPVNASQLSALQGAGVDGSGYIKAEDIGGVGNFPAFAGAVFAKLRNLTQGDPNPLAGMLSDQGLTQSTTI